MVEVGGGGGAANHRDNIGLAKSSFGLFHISSNIMNFWANPIKLPVECFLNTYS